MLGIAGAESRRVRIIRVQIWPFDVFKVNSRTRSRTCMCWPFGLKYRNAAGQGRPRATDTLNNSCLRYLGQIPIPRTKSEIPRSQLKNARLSENMPCARMQVRCGRCTGMVCMNSVGDLREHWSLDSTLIPLIERCKENQGAYATVAKARAKHGTTRRCANSECRRAWLTRVIVRARVDSRRPRTMVVGGPLSSKDTMGQTTPPLYFIHSLTLPAAARGDQSLSFLPFAQSQVDFDDPHDVHQPQPSKDDPSAHLRRSRNNDTQALP